MKKELNPKTPKIIDHSDLFSRRNQANVSSSLVVINNGHSSKIIRVSTGKGYPNVEIEYKEEKHS